MKTPGPIGRGTAALLSVLILHPAGAGEMLDAVKQRGVLHCIVSVGLPGLSGADENDNRIGIDVDLCRAVAAVVLGDAGKVRYTPRSCTWPTISAATLWPMSR